MRRVVGAVVVVALVAGLGWAAWWWTHPTAVDVGLMGGSLTSLEPGRTAYLGLGYAGGYEDDRGEVLRFSDADVDVRASNEAQVEVVVCTRNRDEAATVGSVLAADIDDFCTDLRPLLEDDGRVDGRGMRQYLLLSITASSPGPVRLDRVTLDYRRDIFPWQRGAQTIDADFVARVR